MNLSLRLASAAPFPYGWPGAVMYAALSDDSLCQISSRDGLRDAVTAAMAGEITIIAAWPGQYRTDLFHVDEPARLAEAIGMVTKS